MFKLSKTTKEKIAEAKRLKDIYNEAFVDLYDYLASLAIDESKLIRYNPSRDFIINWLKGTINCLDDYLRIYEDEWLNKVKGRLSYRLLIIFIFLMLKKVNKKIDCPDNAVDFLKHDVDDMLQTISNYLSNIDKHKGSDRYTEAEIKGIADRWQVLLSKTSDLSEYLSQTWK